MIRLAHISDPHLGPLPAFDRGRLLTKQRIGLLNWQRHRSRDFDEAIRLALEADMRASAPDHTIVSGDLINLGLGGEIDAATDWLATLGRPNDVMVVPGNHDAYVPAAMPLYERAWRPFMGGGTGEGPAYPFVRRVGDVALIGLSTAAPSLPLLATGRLGHRQINALAVLLRSLGDDGLCRVIVMHHPPDRSASPWHKRLMDAGALRHAVATEGADLVIHGHNHVNRHAAIPGRHGSVPVVGVAALARRPRADRAGGSWNLYEIAKADGRWRISMTTRAGTPAGGIETVEEKVLA